MTLSASSRSRDNSSPIAPQAGTDEPQGAEIGQGIYDYLIGVYYPNEKKVAPVCEVAGRKERELVGA